MKYMSFLNRIFSNKNQTSFSLKGINEGHHKVTYRGIPCIKCPFDYVIYQMIINDVKPDLIIEIGTNYGGNAYYMADLMNLIGVGEVHTIDVNDKIENEVRNHPRIKFFNNGWENYDLSIVKNFQKIMVIEDASHEYKNTLSAIEKFSSIVSSGSYLIVEDGIVEALDLTRIYNGGPTKAINEFLQKHSEFSVDDKWIDFFGSNATFNISGYLKKI